MEISSITPRIARVALLGVLIVAIGVVFYQFVEGWSFIDALFFCVVTLTTVGYGNIVPVTTAGKLFTTFYILFGIGIFAMVINILVRHGVHTHIKRRDEKED